MLARTNPIPPLASALSLVCVLGWGGFALAATPAPEPSPSGDQPPAGSMTDEHAAGDHEGHEGHDQGGQDHAGHDHAHEEHDHTAATGDDEDPHAHHRAMMSKTGYQRSEHAYTMPDVKVVGMDGAETSLLAELSTDKPVMVNFIFTTCTTICPVMTGVLSQVQKELGPEAANVRMISFSIDPEYDTPERLREYAERFKAGPQWRFFTGDPQEIIAVQRAFENYRGNKMNHPPVTLLRRAEGEPWVRLDGIASAAEVTAEYHSLVHR